jgi:alanine racemase
MTRPTTLSIDIAALQHNLQQVRAYAPHSSIMAMVKANAYGHGIVTAAHALSKADAFGVACLEEGMILREAGVTQPIVLVEGLFSTEELSIAAKHCFTLVVHHQQQVEMLANTQVQRPFAIWLKINTGMNRLGFEPNEVKQVYQRLLSFTSVHHPIGLMTHFADADRTDRDVTFQQRSLFIDLVQDYPGPKSMANSAAILAWSDTHTDWVRPGLMLYGASPFVDKKGSELQLKPVMTLSSRLIAITNVKQGGKVGYGGTWTAPQDMQLGIVGVGYGDGYPQFATNGTPVLINGVECPLVGRVSMDMLSVDLRPLTTVEVGDRVTLWGQGLPVERVALTCKTSPYEILTRITSRPRLQIYK